MGAPGVRHIGEDLGDFHSSLSGQHHQSEQMSVHRLPHESLKCTHTVIILEVVYMHMSTCLECAANNRHFPLWQLMMVKHLKWASHMHHIKMQHFFLSDPFQMLEIPQDNLGRIVDPTRTYAGNTTSWFGKNCCWSKQAVIMLVFQARGLPMPPHTLCLEHWYHFIPIPYLCFLILSIDIATHKPPTLAKNKLIELADC